MAEHNDLGEFGEKKAQDFVANLGYELVELNYRYLKAEVDIIAKDKNELVFIEVKTRSDDGMINPEDAVNSTKKKHIIQVANHYLEENNIALDARFDIVSIIVQQTKCKIHHIKDAFNSVY